MTEYEFYGGVYVLLIGTILLFVSAIFDVFLFPQDVSVYILILGAILSILATYSAATDRDMSSYYRLGRYGRREYLGETSAALTFAFVSVGMSSLPLVIWSLILSEEFNANMLLVTGFTLIAVLFVAIGGYLAWRYWNE